MKKIGLALSLILTTASASELNFQGLEISPLATFNVAEGNLDLSKNRYGYGLRIGYTYDILGVELGYEYEQGKYKAVGTENSENVGINRGYINAILPYKLGDSNFDIYGMIGLGYENFDKNLYDNENGMFAHYGAGLKYKLTDSFGLRLEVRDQIKFRHTDHHLIATFGFVFNFSDTKERKQEPTIVPVNEPEIEPEVKVEPKPEPKACYDLELVNVYFGFDKSNVITNYIPEIKRLARLINEEPAYFVNVRGYTDSIGADKYNEKLSEKRANAVKTELVKAGVSENRINPTWYGKKNAVGDNKTKEGRAANRRVEVKIICQ